MNTVRWREVTGTRNSHSTIEYHWACLYECMYHQQKIRSTNKRPSNNESMAVMCTHHQRDHDEGGREPAGEPLLLFGRSAIGTGRRPRGRKQREALDRRGPGAIHAIEARVGTQLDLSHGRVHARERKSGWLRAWRMPASRVPH